MSPEELEAQSPVHIDKWIDIASEDAQLMDQDFELTKKMMKIGFEDGWMITDSLGRIYGKNPEKGIYFPFHFEYGSLLIGYRNCKKASN